MPLRDSRLFRSLAVAWLVVALGGAMTNAVLGAADLEHRGTDALDDLGVSGSVDVAGRDASVVVEPGADPDAVGRAVGGIDGIRNVDVEVTESTTTTTTSPPRPVRAPGDRDGVSWLVADLVDGTMTLSGTVPDEATAARISAVAQLIYAPLLDVDIEVDPSASAAPWLARAHEIVAVLPVVGTGTVDLAGDSLLVTAASPGRQQAERFRGALAALSGLPVDGVAVKVTDRRPPSIHAVFADGSLVLSGTLPSDEVRSAISRSAVATWGDTAVTDEMVVDTALDTPFWAHRVPFTFPQFSAFADWEFTIENGVTSGALRSGANFSSGSARLTDELEALLQIAAGILSRDPSLALVIEGHTDSVGSEDDNLELSTRRAQAAADFLVAAGIAADRIEPIGYGETRPIADNETAEGREANRRVEFRFATAGG